MAGRYYKTSIAEARATTMKSRIGGGKRRRNRLGCTCIVFLGRSSAAAHGAIFGRRFFIIGGGPNNNHVVHRNPRRTQHGTGIILDTEWRRRGGSLEEEERKDDDDANRAPSHHVSPSPLDSFRREVREILSGCRDDLQEILSGVERDVRQELIARKEKVLQEAMEERYRKEEEEEEPEFDEDLLKALASSAVVDADDDNISSQNRLDIFTELPTESIGDRVTEDEDFDEDVLNALFSSSVVDADEDYIRSQNRLDIFTELPTENDGDRVTEDEDDSESSISGGLSDIDFVVGDTDEEEDAVVERLSTPPSVDDGDEEYNLSLPVPEKNIAPTELEVDGESDQNESSVAVADEAISGGDTDQLPVPKPFAKKKMRTGYKKKQKKSKPTRSSVSNRAAEEIEATILVDDGLPVPTMTSAERKKKKKRPSRKKKKSQPRPTTTLPAMAEESELEMPVDENFETMELVDAESSAILNAVQSLLKLVVATMCFLFACTVINIVMNILFRTLHKPVAK